MGSLEVLRIKPQKNRTKTVGFSVGLSKTINIFFNFFLQNIKISKKIIRTKYFRNFISFIIPNVQVSKVVIKKVCLKSEYSA